MPAALLRGCCCWNCLEESFWGALKISVNVMVFHRLSLLVTFQHLSEWCNRCCRRGRHREREKWVSGRYKDVPTMRSSHRYSAKKNRIQKWEVDISQTALDDWKVWENRWVLNLMFVATSVIDERERGGDMLIRSLLSFWKVNLLL